MYITPWIRRRTTISMVAAIGATFLGLAGAPKCAAAVFYVSPAGNDANPGTQSSPLQTLYQAVYESSSGDTVMLESGVYSGTGDENLTIGSGTLTFQSVTPQQAIIDTGSTVLNVDSDAGVTIDGVAFKGGSNPALYSNGVLAVANCDFFGSSSSAIVAQGGSLSVQDCLFTGNSGSAITNLTSVPLVNSTATTDVTGSEFYGNDGVNGGAIDNESEFSVLSVTDCYFAGNNASNGGAIYDSSGKVTVTNSIFAFNTATGGGGAIDELDGRTVVQYTTCSNNSAAAGEGGAVCVSGSGSGKIALTDDILWDDSSEIGGQNVTGAYSDVDGGLSGTSIISANPLFADVPDANFEPQSGSPVFGQGTPITGVTTDYSGASRSSTPTLGAFEDAAGKVIPGTHVAWTSSSGALSLWNYDPASGHSSQNTYGPYAGWTAASIADGPDGYTRVLWVNTGGEASIWSVNAATGALTQNSFGPFPGWTARTVAVGPNDTTYVLWAGAGTASIWNYNTNSGTFTPVNYGPFPGWTATSIAASLGTNVRLLWNNTNGAAALWSLDPLAGNYTQYSFGPYPGWTADAITVSAQSITHVLWTNSGGAAALWNYSPGSGAFTQQSYGPFAGWTATAVAEGPDNLTRMVWDNVGGTASIWSLDNATGAFTQYSFGPYPDWTATGISIFP
ncbi:MAG: DUF1565 domain-containing protein [Capsulimonadaceae bacterium]